MKCEYCESSKVVWTCKGCGMSICENDMPCAEVRRIIEESKLCNNCAADFLEGPAPFRDKDGGE